MGFSTNDLDMGGLNEGRVKKTYANIPYGHALNEFNTDDWPP
jgi:hypothetical protein